MMEDSFRSAADHFIEHSGMPIDLGEHSGRMGRIKIDVDLPIARRRVLRLQVRV